MIKAVEIAIPTRNRLKKLQACLASLPKAVDGVALTVTVICDGDAATAAELLHNPRVDKVLFLRAQRGSVYCRNLVSQSAEDAFLYATDDIEFRPGALEWAARSLDERFADGDGVVGFNQENSGKFCRAGVALVGQRFLQRYPNRKLFYPGYFHFSCQEIERAAEALGKFYYCPEAKLIHHHPSLEPRQLDQTHAEARRLRAEDLALSKTRRRAGLLWGVR
jgi:hypothetical protein